MAEMFGITGGGTLALAWLIAFTAFGLTVRHWARLGRPGPRAVLQRIAVLLLVPLLLVVAVALSVNLTGLWFVSWKDLGSVVTGPHVGHLRQFGDDAAAAAQTDVGPWGGAGARGVTVGAPKADRFTHLTTYTVRGEASGYTGVVHVWQAPGAAGPGGRPTIQLFHGYPVSAQSAFANLKIAQHVSAQVPGALVLVPDWSPGEVDTECVDGPEVKMETWLTRDVPAWAAAEFGASTARGGWATLGYSAGGWCSAAMAMRHPQTYSAGISLGGAMRPEFSGSYKPVATHGGDYDLPKLARENPPAVALLTQFSQRDAYAAPSTNDLVEATDPPLSVTVWDTPDAGHRVGAWEPLVPEALDWLTRTAPGFPASA